MYPTAPLPEDPHKMKDLIDGYGMGIADIYVDVSSEAKFKHGSFCTSEKSIRDETIRICKAAADFASEIPGAALTLWPGQDGFDYAFQVDYLESWKRMVDSFQQICAHKPAVQINLEYKQQDPRQRFFINDVGKMVMFFHDVGAENLKGCVDTGHSLQALEQPAESALQLYNRGKLGTVHNNDNYRNTDSDLLFNSIAFYENLEFYYHLRKTDYSGWNEIETVLRRNDREKGMHLAVKMIRNLYGLAGKLLEKREEIEGNLEDYWFIENMEIISELIF